MPEGTIWSEVIQAISFWNIALIMFFIGNHLELLLDRLRGSDRVRMAPSLLSIILQRYASIITTISNSFNCGFVLVLEFVGYRLAIFVFNWLFCSSRCYYIPGFEAKGLIFIYLYLIIINYSIGHIFSKQMTSFQNT